MTAHATNRLITKLIRKLTTKFLPFIGNTRQPTLPNEQIRKLGLLYSAYRFIISVFLFISSYAVILENDLLTVQLPTLLQQSSLLFYGLFSLLLLAFFLVIRSNSNRQLAIGLFVDVLFLSMLLFINGAPDLQLTMLYMVVVAASFMLLVPYQALIITLLAVICVIYLQFFQALTDGLNLQHLGEALLLSLSFIFVGFLSLSISSRLAHVEKLAIDKQKEVNRLNAITQQVIGKMNQGILVLNKHKQVMISNTSTNTLLSLTIDYLNPEVMDTADTINVESLGTIYTSQKHISKQIAEHHPELFSWLNKAVLNTQSQLIYKLPTPHATLDKLRVTATPMQDGMILVMLEDLRREQTNAQQLKLASLGQLTASIAHEIRNPLAAISQASQLLLLESDDDAWEDNTHEDNTNEDSHTNSSTHNNLSPNNESSNSNNSNDPNLELYNMIFNQTKRVNRIIEDVLKLSRQAKPEQSKLSIVDWLDSFIDNHYRDHDVFLHAQGESSLYFDPHQLEQILINLINNGLRFSSKAHPHAFVEVEVFCIKDNVIIDVLDEGAGISKDKQANLFMPFFTTDHEGTGLGLYLSQAFAEANFAKLLYIPEHEKTCFRLIIPQAMPNDYLSIQATESHTTQTTNSQATESLDNLDNLDNKENSTRGNTKNNASSSESNEDNMHKSEVANTPDMDNAHIDNTNSHN